MRPLRDCCLAIACIALAVTALRLVPLVSQEVQQAQKLTAALTELSASSKAAVEAAHQAIPETAQHASEAFSAVAQAGKQTSATLQDVQHQVSGIDPRLDNLGHALQEQTVVLNDTFKDLTDPYRHAGEALDTSIRDLRPQLIGLTAAAKVTAGESAQAMREIQRATPQITAKVEDVAAHLDLAAEKSVEATELARQVTANIAAGTKPLPRPVRLALQIGGPLAQVTSYLILILEQLGII